VAESDVELHADARASNGALTGLTSAEAARRLATYGPNRLREADMTSRWRILLAQFTEPLVYLLFGAMAVSMIVWAIEGFDSVPFEVIVIAAIVVLNAAIGYVQEDKAQKAVAALSRMTAPTANVVRDGVERQVAAEEIVPGDLLVIREGDIVAADASLLEGAGLRTQEAALTGESLPVDKVAGDHAYKGTTVAAGSGRAEVTATGMETEFGRIAQLLDQTADTRTPLQDSIARVTRFLAQVVIAIAVVVIVALIILNGVDSASDLIDTLLIGVSLGVAAIPEGLPAVLSLVLALGVQRMAGKNALVRNLASVETLGSATVVCTDKTGTLTHNEMTVRRLVVASGEVEFSGAGYEPVGDVTTIDGDVDRGEVERAVRAGVLASDAGLIIEADRWQAQGDPTEAAIVVAAHKMGVEHEGLRRRFRRLGQISFTSQRQRMSTVQPNVLNGGSPAEVELTVKGAPDTVLPLCSSEQVGADVVDLTTDRRVWWEGEVDRLADQALRTLAVAYRPLDGSELDSGELLDETVERDLVLLGVFGMVDPPRPEVPLAVAESREAGIRVVMITGDHPRTAVEIALELGIFHRGDRALTGRELDELSDDELAAAVGRVSVFARVKPEHKLRIVQALRANGEITAMTGDGVNDAPGLKAADIGVAMGRSGTDVAKEASDMVLTDDNFATIIAAVREGRTIYHNIRSFLRYLLCSNVGEVLAVLFGVILASVIGLKAAAGDSIATPLLATQILWLNLLTDSGPALALGVDPAQGWLMNRRPRRRDDPVIDRPMQLSILIIGFTMAVVTLLMLDLVMVGGLFEADGDLTMGRTGAFTVLMLCQLVNCFTARSQDRSVFSGHGSNRWLWIAVTVSLVLHLAVVYLPFLNRAFETTALSASQWLLAAVLSSAVLWVSEAEKLVRRRLADGRRPSVAPLVSE
jgi:magnesium-transporting ATPase (P-type)